MFVCAGNVFKPKKKKKKRKEKIKHPRKYIKIEEADSAANKRKWRK